MKVLNIIPNTPEWLTHRLTHLNASEAAAVIGVSPYMPYDAQDLMGIKTGMITKEITPYMQGLFDHGHVQEYSARGLYKKLYNITLSPCVLTLDVGVLPLSASIDGMTLDQSKFVEIKCPQSSSSSLWKSCLYDEIPMHYKAQLEQQLIVTGHDKCEFMVYLNDKDWKIILYKSDAELRKRILTAWSEFYTAWRGDQAKAKTGDATAMSDGFRTQWAQASGLWHSAKIKTQLAEYDMKFAEARLKELRDSAASEYGVSRVYGMTVQVGEYERKGSINWKKVAEVYKLPPDELEKYRAATSKYTKIMEYDGEVTNTTKQENTDE